LTLRFFVVEGPGFAWGFFAIAVGWVEAAKED